MGRQPAADLTQRHRVAAVRNRSLRRFNKSRYIEHFDQCERYHRNVHNPIALTPPVFNSNVPVGAFRIVVPSYDSNSETYYVGTGLQSQSGLVILTTYIVANPNTQVDVTPTTTFYVAIGNYKTGQQIPSQISSYGKCDTSAKRAFTADSGQIDT
jgi:hypothetical protein